MRKIELLAPAKDLECGIAAITHGADAVYIGAARFGARAAAGNSIEDIEKLCRFAHVYAARVYVTVNTIIYDDELEDTRNLLCDLERIGVDAILVQDMALLEAGRSVNIPLHASTQTDNRTAEKVRWLRSAGFRRVVLARELSAMEIAEIHREVPDIEIEVFVHGALCVSYSGQCYASQHCFGRSANRGECAQFCRLKFQLEDADGNKLGRPQHFLSLKDMCQVDRLEELIDAGAVSFKIEGRLKDAAYVKNVVAAYSQRLNGIVKKSGGRLARASLGTAEYTFTPNLEKTFNRGFTNYFIDGRKPGISSPDTPKATGEFVGTVKEIRGRRISVAGTASFANGDGLCYINGERELEGFRVNRAENNVLFPARMPRSLRPGMSLYRNNDQQFERELSRDTAVRKIPVTLSLVETADGFSLNAMVAGTDNDAGIAATAGIHVEKQEARTPQRENIVRQLTKLGDTPFSCIGTILRPQDFNFFIPSSLLAASRRDVTARLSDAISDYVRRLRDNTTSSSDKPSTPPPHMPVPYMYNISNHVSRAFYEACGVDNAGYAFEVRPPARHPVIMQCRHCLRYSLGCCANHGGKRPSWREPLFLTLPDGRRFPLEFDCKNCQMNIYAE